MKSAIGIIFSFGNDRICRVQARVCLIDCQNDSNKQIWGKVCAVDLGSQRVQTSTRGRQV
jgi:hypothetical protein